MTEKPEPSRKGSPLPPEQRASGRPRGEDQFVVAMDDIQPPGGPSVGAQSRCRALRMEKHRGPPGGQQGTAHLSPVPRPGAWFLGHADHGQAFPEQAPRGAQAAADAAGPAGLRLKQRGRLLHPPRRPFFPGGSVCGPRPSRLGFRPGRRLLEHTSQTETAITSACTCRCFLGWTFFSGLSL